MNDPTQICECSHTRGLHWHGAGGVAECSACDCRAFIASDVIVELEAVFGTRPCLACNHPYKMHANHKPNRYCEEAVCCCTNYVSSPADLGRWQTLHPGATA